MVREAVLRCDGFTDLMAFLVDFHGRKEVLQESHEIRERAVQIARVGPDSRETLSWTMVESRLQDLYQMYRDDEVSDIQEFRKLARSYVNVLLEHRSVLTGFERLSTYSMQVPSAQLIPFSLNQKACSASSPNLTIFHSSTIARNLISGYRLPRVA